MLFFHFFTFTTLFAKISPIMSLDRLRSLANSRKWYDFTELIKEEAARGIHPEQLASVVELLHGYIQKIHPISISSTAIALASVVSPQEASDLLDAAIEAIHSTSLNEDDYLQELNSLRMHKCMVDIKLGRLEDIESQLIAWKSSKLSDENFSLLHLVAGQFYESTGDTENAQEQYLAHAKLTKSVIDIEKLLRLSLLSKTFFDFSSVAAFKEFDTLENKGLKLLFSCFQKGDLSRIDKSQLLDILKVDNIDYIRDKIYLVNIMMICFRSEEKFVHFDTFISELAIDEVTLLGLLLKALGINIITGWVDSEQRMLFFDKVIPRALGSDEFARMKCKFTEWRERIGKVIRAIEQED